MARAGYIACMRYAPMIFLLSLLPGFGLMPAARADIYVFVDADGVRHYTNAPTSARYAEMRRQGIVPGTRTHQSPRPGVGRFDALVEQAAREHEIDVALLRAVIAVESNYDPNAVSHRGAVGLMQLMPTTAERYGVTDLTDPAQNIRGGAQYLSYLMRKFDNDLTLVLAAYNAGEGAVMRHGNRIPPYRETRMYVPKVLESYRWYQSLVGRGGSESFN